MITMTTKLFRLGSLSAFALAASVSLAPVASADTYAPPATDAQAAKLAKLGKENKSNYAMKDSKFKVARAEIFARVWGLDFETDSHVLAVYIGYVRRKLQAAGNEDAVP